jgi:hypothetical protein
MDELPEGRAFIVLTATALIGGIVLIIVAFFKLINTITL